VETQPPNFAHAEYLPLLIMLGISIILLLIQRAKFTPAQFFLIIGFGIMSLFSARNAHLFGVVAPFTLASGLNGMSSSGSLRRVEEALTQMESQVAGSVKPVILTILLSIALTTSSLGKLNRFERSVFPVDAVQWLEDHPQSGRMFNAFDWGGYILFHLWPGQKVFIESQTDVTGEVTQKYEAVIALHEGWQEILNQYNVTWAMIPPKWPLASELIAQGWNTAYKDSTAVILIK
jgi:hypothetical protein